ncbi:MAG: hypothetical protein EBS84_21615 [Proteobacteria bacterium]|nr:hypothetical protein [Pseudomonadota bacterium]
MAHNLTADNLPNYWHSEYLFLLLVALSVLLDYPELPDELLKTLYANALSHRENASVDDATGAEAIVQWLANILGNAASGVAPKSGVVELPYSQKVITSIKAAASEIGAAAAQAVTIPALLAKVNERAIERFPKTFRHPDPDAIQLMAQLYSAVQAAEPAVGAATPIESDAAAAASSPLADARALLVRAGLL